MIPNGTSREPSPEVELRPYDPSALPDYDTEFITQEELDSFAQALSAPTTESVTALNDWGPVRQKVKKNRARRRTPRRTKDETREGFVYTLLYYPLLLFVCGWIVVLFIIYNLTRLYIYVYEHLFSWRGRRETLRRRLQHANTYNEWQAAAHQLDVYLGNEEWKRSDPYSYYNHQTIRKVTSQLLELDTKVRAEEIVGGPGKGGSAALEELKSLLESCNALDLFVAPLAAGSC